MAARASLELNLHGDEVSKIVTEKGVVEEEVFSSGLKVLSFTSCSALQALPSFVGHLKDLLTLTVSHCGLCLLPDEMGQLTELKYLDLSFNALESLPESLGQCVHMQTINLSHNKLRALPLFEKGLETLRRLDISHNEFQVLPLPELRPKGLHEMIACTNQLTSLSDDIHTLTLLKDLDVSDNQLEVLPVELTACTKLKCLNVEGNPIKDRRLAKLLASHGLTKPKSILDYLSTFVVAAASSSGTKSTKSKKKAKSKSVSDDQVVEKPVRFFVRVLQSDPIHTVTFVDTVLPVRPFIVCVIVKGLDLSAQEVMRNFISLQTKLHEGVCEKRRVATIATHDLGMLQFPLTFEARQSSDIEIRPLGQSTDVTAADLVQELSASKKGDSTGLKRFLGLIPDPDLYACFMDATGKTISLPPLTNCDQTKVSALTKDVFVEVTSRKSVGTCRMVLDLFVGKLLDGRFALSGNQEQDLDDWLSNEKPPGLVVQQVRVNTSNGKLRVIYPSRDDLVIDSVKVERSFLQK